MTMTIQRGGRGEQREYAENNREPFLSFPASSPFPSALSAFKSNA
jgi:hypothetical protein